MSGQSDEGVEGLLVKLGAAAEDVRAASALVGSIVGATPTAQHIARGVDMVIYAVDDVLLNTSVRARALDDLEQNVALLCTCLDEVDNTASAILLEKVQTITAVRTELAAAVARSPGGGRGDRDDAGAARLRRPLEELLVALGALGGELQSAVNLMAMFGATPTEKQVQKSCGIAMYALHDLCGSTEGVTAKDLRASAQDVLSALCSLEQGLLEKEGTAVDIIRGKVGELRSALDELPEVEDEDEEEGAPGDHRSTLAAVRTICDELIDVVSMDVQAYPEMESMCLDIFLSINKTAKDIAASDENPLLRHRCTVLSQSFATSSTEFFKQAQLAVTAKTENTLDDLEAFKLINELKTARSSILHDAAYLTEFYAIVLDLREVALATVETMEAMAHQNSNSTVRTRRLSFLGSPAPVSSLDDRMTHMADMSMLFTTMHDAVVELGLPTSADAKLLSGARALIPAIESVLNFKVMPPPLSKLASTLLEHYTLLKKHVEVAELCMADAQAVTTADSPSPLFTKKRTLSAAGARLMDAAKSVRSSTGQTVQPRSAKQMQANYVSRGDLTPPLGRNVEQPRSFQNENKNSFSDWVGFPWKGCKRSVSSPHLSPSASLATLITATAPRATPREVRDAKEIVPIVEEVEEHLRKMVQHGKAGEWALALPLLGEAEKKFGGLEAAIRKKSLFAMVAEEMDAASMSAAKLFDAMNLSDSESLGALHQQVYADNVNLLHTLMDLADLDDLAESEYSGGSINARSDDMESLLSLSVSRILSPRNSMASLYMGASGSVAGSTSSLQPLERSGLLDSPVISATVSEDAGSVIIGSGSSVSSVASVAEVAHDEPEGRPQGEIVAAPLHELLPVLDPRVQDSVKALAQLGLSILQIVHHTAKTVQDANGEDGTRAAACQDIQDKWTLFYTAAQELLGMVGGTAYASDPATSTFAAAVDACSDMSVHLLNFATGELDLLYDSARDITQEVQTVMQAAAAVTSAQPSTLDLSFRNLTVTPAELWSMTRLVELHLYSNELTQLPSDISALVNLTSLHVNRNKLTVLPDEVCSLLSLRELYADHNLLTRLPSKVGDMTNLLELVVGSNQISELPEGISKLANLEMLVLEDNPLPKHILDASSKGPQDVLALTSSTHDGQPQRIASALLKDLDLDSGW